MEKHFSLKRKLTAALLLIVLLVSLLCPEALAAFDAKINSNSARVYQYPTTSAASYNNLAGLVVTVTAYRGDWAQVTYRGRVGYMYVKDLDLTTAIPGWTNCDTTVYSGPYSPMGVAPKGTKVWVFGYYSGYCRVMSEGGNVGYISLNDLSRSYVAPAAASSGSASTGKSTGNSSIDKVLYAAYNLLGQPYSSDANPPYSFDCSAFCRTCYGYAGYSVGRTAYDQGYDNSYTKITSLGSIRVGDMLCFNTNEDDDDLSDHTAIYIGDGKFVHASSNAGAVIVSELTNYYIEHFSWARRII